MIQGIQPETSIPSPQPAWPSKRDLPRYNELCALDIRTKLANGGRWIDIGPGESAQALRGAMDISGVELIGFSPHKCDADLPIKIYYHALPGDQALLDSFAHSATLVTDVFAGISYAADPLSTLLYESLMLKPGGEIRVVTEVKRFGDETSRQKITDFVGRNIATRLHFEEFETYADARQAKEKELRIIGFKEAVSPSTDLDYLRLRMVEEVGIPVRSEVLFSTGDGLARILEVNYLPYQQVFAPLDLSRTSFAFQR